MKRLLLWLIRFYRSAISPRKPGMCKYIPTCSQYGLEAIERFGALKGGLLTLWRILRCNPWSRGGYDPVPEKKTRRMISAKRSVTFAMVQIFSFFGSILGYLLWLLYNIFPQLRRSHHFLYHYRKAGAVPFSIKSQRSMASQPKLSVKQKELQEKYGNNREKYSEELMKLYEKEGVSPSSGCLTTLLPLPIMLGIYYSVIMPLSNTLHIASDRISQATDFIGRIPGMVASSTTGGIYAEMEIIRNFDALKEYLTMFPVGPGQDRLLHPGLPLFWGWTCWQRPRARAFSPSCG